MVVFWLLDAQMKDKWVWHEARHLVINGNKYIHIHLYIWTTCMNCRSITEDEWQSEHIIKLIEGWAYFDIFPLSLHVYFKKHTTVGRDSYLLIQSDILVYILQKLNRIPVLAGNQELWETLTESELEEAKFRCVS